MMFKKKKTKTEAEKREDLIQGIEIGTVVCYVLLVLKSTVGKYVKETKKNIRKQAKRKDKLEKMKYKEKKKLLKQKMKQKNSLKK